MGSGPSHRFRKSLGVASRPSQLTGCLFARFRSSQTLGGLVDRASLQVPEDTGGSSLFNCRAPAGPTHLTPVLQTLYALVDLTDRFTSTTAGFVVTDTCVSRRFLSGRPVALRPPAGVSLRPLGLFPGENRSAGARVFRRPLETE